MKAILIVVLLPVIYYVLYVTGYMVVGSKSARIFVGKNRGTSAYWSQFVDCTGTLKRVARFRKSKEYTFRLDIGMANGTAAIEIVDRNKDVLLRLNSETPEGSMVVDKKLRYYMIYKFEHATGSYELKWE